MPRTSDTRSQAAYNWDAPTIDQMMKIVADAAGLKLDEVTPDATLPELGLESKDLLALLAQGKKDCQVDISTKEAASTRNIGEFFRLAVSKSA